MLTLREWGSKDEFVVSVGNDWGAAARSTLLQLMHGPGGCAVPLADVDEEESAEQRLLGRWAAGGLVHAEDVPGRGDME
eukprot:6295190-Lingulodinium_polyedra.AAC.1